ncbi:MFS transporter [Beauveria bassiana ARSEF 2860]|uniref:MFS transporter n=1 Tax=Beauveria bassiana (strain ARSEF 2860) TaxID=655819 RepID=J4KPD5_BEAB2|nr:MFS transporter [Beauveria bassiana ARSEF 2860]EJP67264.1 MFS transporter [Beauveria bassiana ARSEF 2860]
MVGNGMTDTPLNEISEAIICRNIFGQVPDPASDPRCKDSQVQAELALISGWELTFGLIPSLVVGVPFGLAADKYGRRAVILLTSVGVVLSTLLTIVICRYPETFSLRLRWLAPILMLIGGGMLTLSAMSYTVIADISTKAYRSTAFLWMATTVTACSLVASPLTYFMMNEMGAWFTLIFGFALMTLAIPIAAFVPETRPAAVVRRAETACKIAETNSRIDNHSPRWISRSYVRSTWQHLSLINRTLFAGNPTVGLLISSTIFITVGKSVVIMLLQFCTASTANLGICSQAGLLIGVKQATSLTLTALALPALSQFLLRIGMAPLVKDWWIVRVSAVISVVGSLAMGLAQTVQLFIGAMMFAECGIGLQAALRGLVTELIDETHIALVMTVLSLFMTISEMVAGPLMAQMFKVGMDWGGVWVGMPYLASAAMLSVGAVLVMIPPIVRHVATSPAV